MLRLMVARAELRQRSELGFRDVLQMINRLQGSDHRYVGVAVKEHQLEKDIRWRLNLTTVEYLTVENCLVKALSHANNSQGIRGVRAHDITVIIMATEYR
ncbi:hypothetical protein E2P81_ATG05461 [Venturia nashicola]|uniref:Uncharacterized protein n=1 Tax=Venturia nashicola TaxID=86259 RepID=A0A4Z1PFV2_9PEZI|nr:hypothetical protein E6O75_ATG05597 [Venturia nashicola]TLD32485.1 hypothetical protein E2P81_ATG05461 [Venturia nashicola]